MTASCQQTVCGWLVSPDPGLASDIPVIPYMSLHDLSWRWQFPTVVCTGGVTLKWASYVFQAWNHHISFRSWVRTLRDTSKKNERIGIKFDGLHPHFTVQSIAVFVDWFATSKSLRATFQLHLYRLHQVATAIWAKFSQRHHQTRRSELFADLFLLGDSVDLRGDWCHLRSFLFGTQW